MHEKDVIYDRFGTPLLRLFDNDNFVTFLGFHTGFLAGDAVFNYSGRQVGWYEGGILRDLSGNVVGFGLRPTDYPSPLLPLKQLKPLPMPVQVAPLRPVAEIRHIKPIKSFSWSHLSPVDLFASR